MSRNLAEPLPAGDLRLSHEAAERRLQALACPTYTHRRCGSSTSTAAAREIGAPRRRLQQCS